MTKPCDETGRRATPITVFVARLNAGWKFYGMEKLVYGVFLSDLVRFIKTVCDIVAFRNPYSVKSLKFKHVLFRFVYNNDAASNVKVNEPELLAPFLYSSLFTEMVERNIITQKNNKK